MRLHRIIAPIALITMLTGCSGGSMFGMGSDQNSTTYEQCTRLKRQIIFFKNDPNHHYQWGSPANRAILLSDYQRLNCEDVLAHRDNVPSNKRPMSTGWKKP